MSSQKGNVACSRPQKHQHPFSFKNDKFDKSILTKRIHANLHDGVCQHCKEVLQWHVKYSKYKSLSKPKKKKCVKCLEKMVKVPYYRICRPCACELEVGAKCEKKTLLLFNKEPKRTENGENDHQSSHSRICKGNEESDDDSDFSGDLDDTDAHPTVK